jgi:hypothetical protein
MLNICQWLNKSMKDQQKSLSKFYQMKSFNCLSFELINSLYILRMPAFMRTLIRKLMQLERQLLFVKLLYKTNNNHLAAGLVLYTMRNKKKSYSNLFNDLFSSSFTHAIPIINELKENDRFFITW